MSTSSSQWRRFFADAGIPEAAAQQYAVNFVENRISLDMLLELNKDYLRDLGIFVLGDIIAILRHARAVQGKMTTGDRSAASSATTAAARDAATAGGSRASVPTEAVTKTQAPIPEKRTIREAEALRSTISVTAGPSSSSSAGAAKRAASAATVEAAAKPIASSSRVSARLGPPTAIKFADLAPSPSSKAPPTSPPTASTAASKSVFARLDQRGSKEEDVRRVRVTDDRRGVSPSAVRVTKDSAFSRLDSKTGTIRVQRDQAFSAASSRLPDSRGTMRISTRTTVNPQKTRSAGILSSSSTPDAPSSTATSVGGKKKSYILVRTLKDGTKIREKISEDDPILDKVKVKKVRSGGVSSSQTSSSQSKSLPPRVRFGSLESAVPISGRVHSSPPREPRKRLRITAPGPDDEQEFLPRKRRASPEPVVRKRISAPDDFRSSSGRADERSSAKSRLGHRLGGRLGY